MRRPPEFGDDWDQEPHGVVPSEHLRPWRHRRNYVLTAALGLSGFLLLLGALGFFAPVRLVGALAVLGSSVSVWRSDVAAGSARAAEVLWLVVASGLLVGGLVLYADP